MHQIVISSWVSIPSVLEVVTYRVVSANVKCEDWDKRYVWKEFLYACIPLGTGRGVREVCRVVFFFQVWEFVFLSDIINILIDELVVD